MTKKTHQVYLGLGSNLDNPAFQLQKAINEIGQHPDIDLMLCSSFYSSKPIGPQDQPDFVNAVCEIATPLDPYQLLNETQSIEHKMGRIKTRHWGERCIDIDILLYGNLTIESETLIIPHCQLTQRDFVVIPLLEIAPTQLMPNGESLQQIAKDLQSNQLVKLGTTR